MTTPVDDTGPGFYKMTLDGLLWSLTVDGPGWHLDATDKTAKQDGWAWFDSSTDAMLALDPKTAAQSAQAQALVALQALIPNLAPALAQAQQDAVAYPAATTAAQAAIVQRLIGNTAALAEGVAYLLAHLGLMPDGS